MPKKFYQPYRDNHPTRERLREVLDYDAETGTFTWKVQTGRAKPGAVAGFSHQGYTAIRITGKNYQAHYLAWIIVYAEPPQYRLGHRDGNRRNNAITNLFEDSDDYGTGIDDMTGVYRCVHDADKFTSSVYDGEGNVRLGTFRTAKGARMARLNALDRMTEGLPARL